MAQVLIATRLGDGRVVFLGAEEPDGLVWTELLDDAQVLEGDTADALQVRAEREASERNEVLDPYLIDVERRADGGLRPTKYREAIRALGPSNRADLGKQAEGARA